MRRWGFLGLAAAVVTTAAMAAAPAFAATSYVQVPLSSQFNALTLLNPGQSASQTASNSACHTTKGATYGPSHAVNASGLPTGSFTSPNGVPFTLGPVDAKDAVCIRNSATATSSEPTSVTIPVPAGKYTDAYFLASLANGPQEISITPVYGTTNGTPITALFDDWCGPSLTGGSLTADTTAVFPKAGDRLASNGGTPQANLPCTYYDTHISGLSSSQTLTALQITQALKGGAPIPAATGVPANQTAGPTAVLNIAAITLQGTQSASSSSTSLPKTGGNQTGILIGAGLLAIGGTLMARRRRASRQAS